MDIEENVIFGAPVNWMTEYDYVSASEYITALYWSVMTLTTIGYGDVAPVTLGEQCLCIFAMLLGGSIYAYVIGAVCGIVSSMDEATTAYHKTMDELNIFMVENKLPKELRVRLREYFQHCRQLQRAQHYQDLLVHMSPMLRGEVAVFCNREWVLKVPFFNGAPEEETNNFITSIALALVLEAYAPHETIIKKGEPTEKMYIVQRGVVSRLGHVYSSGACVGEDMILKGAKRTSDVRALTYVDVSGLHRVRTRVGGLLESMHGVSESNIRCASVVYPSMQDALLDIVNRGHFPVISKIIRNAAIRMALRREFIHYAKSIAAIRARKPSHRNLDPVDVAGAKLQGGGRLSQLALTPRGLQTGSQRALAGVPNLSQRSTGRGGSMRSSPLRPPPMRVQSLAQPAGSSDEDATPSDGQGAIAGAQRRGDGDLNLLQAAVDVSPNKLNNDQAIIADADFKRVIADAERELGIPAASSGSGGGGGVAAGSPAHGGFRRSSLLDRITTTRRGARRSLDGLDAAAMQRAVGASPQPGAQLHAAEEAAGAGPAAPQGRFLEPLGGLSPASAAVAAVNAAAGRRLSAGRTDLPASDAAAEAAATTTGQRSVMRLITQRCNHVERLVESTRAAILHRLTVRGRRAHCVMVCIQSRVRAGSVCRTWTLELQTWKPSSTLT